jgi:LCP family protein required for cell wall assembly
VGHLNRQNHPSRRRAKKRVSGRFLGFLAVLIILIVAAIVFFATRPPRDTAVTSGETAQTDQPTQAAGDDWAAEDAQAQAQADAAKDASDGPMTIEEILEQNPDLAPLEGDEKVKVSDLSVTEGLSEDWHNILLLGSDTRNIKKVSRTDTIIIASINIKDGRIKLSSIMRDTVVPIPGHGDRKINSASYYGGPQLTIKVVNQCFKMNITEYVLVNFGSFKEIIDILGGIDLDISKKEMGEVNNSLKEQARLLKLDKSKYLAGEYDLKTYGPDTHLDGLQALGYARIRHIDSDYERTRRQRRVIDATIQKMRGSVSVKQLVQLATSMWQYIDTNVDMMSAIGLATTVLKSGIGEMASGLMPITGSYKSETRSSNGAALYDIDFEKNASKLNEFIYVK